MPQLNISLPAALKGWIDGRISEGRYSSPSEYIRSLVRRDQDEAVELEWLQAEIDKGLASPIIDRDARDVLREIMEENRALNVENRTAA